MSSREQSTSFPLMPKNKTLYKKTALRNNNKINIKNQGISLKFLKVFNNLNELTKK
jgi:hypothetical protein